MADADPKIPPQGDRVAAANVIESVEAPAPAPKQRRWGRIGLMAAVPLLLAAVAGYFYLTGGRYVSTDNAYVQQDTISISPDVSGRIVQVNVKENQRVKAGDVLFVIDQEPYKLALAQADAALATARVQVATMSTDTGSANADVASANADIKLAQATYDRQATLMKQGFTTRAAFDAAAQQVAAARARLATAQASVAKAQVQVGSGVAGSGVPAAVAVALAEREKALLNLNRTVVRAPRDGIISQTNRLQVGNITPSGVPALSLVAQAPWVTANFKETDLANMRVGQPAELTFDAYPGVKVCGRVQSIGAETGSASSILPAQNATGNWVKVTQRVPVRIAITCKTDRALIAGLSSDVSIDTKPNG
ncbi:HlyD family secretion protein [Sphingomonas panacisoli]|uniref:HlyD family secretion protein n=1 Tax=Sphingomonas panacisoli TaxID=1813879 RepID=A0A5B8LIM0_9SPHN|nr:HlyD family secretion protein [Sphingomonas panacisoli]QDZ07689.1 HlyD family secretion protein [Sphingomonas panacisoli]